MAQTCGLLCRDTKMISPQHTEDINLCDSRTLRRPSYWSWGPPPDDRTVVIHVGDWRPTDSGSYFTGCRNVATVDSGLGIANGEQGTAVSVCRGLRQPWSIMWPALRTIS
jgi:hypothetical protein